MKKKHKITRILTLKEVRDALVFLSRGGDPDDFIPTDAQLRIDARRRLRLSWFEGALVEHAAPKSALPPVPKWDVRIGPTETVPSLNPKTGKWGETTGRRVRYRKNGSKGRFEDMFLVGELPQDTQAVVDGHVELLARQRQGGD